MKLSKTRQAARITKLNLAKETIRSLQADRLADVHGGMVDLHTSFSCGRDLCSTH